MGFLFFTHPSTGKKDVMLTMTLLSMLACVVKFFFEGASFSILGHIITIGHADASTYGSILAPILSSHGVREWKLNGNSDIALDSQSSMKVDNPDA